MTTTAKAKVRTVEELRVIATGVVADHPRTPIAALAAHWLVCNPVPKPLPENLTERQREIFCFVRKYQQLHQVVPTTRCIGRQFFIKSPNAIVGHLKALEKKGLIIRGERCQAHNFRIAAEYL